MNGRKLLYLTLAIGLSLGLMTGLTHPSIHVKTAQAGGDVTWAAVDGFHPGSGGNYLAAAGPSAPQRQAFPPALPRLQGTPELALTKSVSAGSFQAGDVLAYTVVVSNEGSAPATNVTVSDPLPAGTSYVTDSLTVVAPSQFYMATISDDFESSNYSGGVGWSGDWLETNEADGPFNGSVQVIADPDNQPTVANKVLVFEGTSKGIRRAADLPDTSMATLSFDYRRIDLEGENYVEVQLSTNSGASWFTLTRIVGTDEGGGVTDATYRTASFGIGSYSANRILIQFVTDDVWADGPSDRFFLDKVRISYQAHAETQTGPPPILASGYYLPAGERMTLTYEVQVDDPLDPSISQLVNTASATSNEVVTPATATAVVEIKRPQLALTKTSSILQNVSPGDRMTYTIFLSNAGEAPATNVTVSDPLPAGTSYVEDSLTVVAPSQLYMAAISDDFESGNYSGGVGWSGDWLETNEADGPFNGSVQVIADPDNQPTVANKVLVFETAGKGIRRAADLPDTSMATLSFDYRRIDLEGENYVEVQLSTNSGASWFTLTRIVGTDEGGGVTDATYQTASYDISPFADYRILIQFVTDPQWTDGPSDRFFLDKVRISYQVHVETQTGPPPILASGYYLPAGERMTLTYEVQVDDPLDPSISQLVNTVTVTSNETPTPATASVTTTVANHGPGTRFVFLPMLLRPAPAELSVVNENTGDVIRFEVRDPQTKAEVTSCNVPNNTTQFCGSFPAGTYEVQAFTACGGADPNPIATITYQSGPVTTRVFCR